MIEQLKTKLEGSLYKGFIDQNKTLSTTLKPKLLSNKDQENVLTTLLQELNTCNSFIFSVAFITEGGLATLKTSLYELEKRGIKGRILTSTFLGFNNPKTFKELLKIPNIEVRVSDEKGFHSKGYIFEQKDYFSLIVGSSNLTDSALKTNFEWNIYLNSLENGEVIKHFYSQFETTWNNAQILNEDWIIKYQQQYTAEMQNNRKANLVSTPPLYLTNSMKEALEIQPNKMQVEALTQLKALRETGASKGLIISATGTGKTYLSAFDVRQSNPNKVLFIVHREQILKKAMQDYRKVLGGNEEDFGILSGNNKDLNARYLFATVQTISRDPYLNNFSKDHFDYILIDEVHRAGAESYLKIINHFEPKFLLGMTATPERTDNFNIFELFDYNIAYEIRLQAALEEEMLCPFHYFGVVDYEIDGNTIDETTTLQKLISNERVAHLIEKTNYYGYSGDKLRGLMFCSSKDEARELSNVLNFKGFKTTYLTGEHSQEEREQAISKLEKGELEYILTVDIFNEGIDIPFVNQIVMLRQTQSSIIFIQQLGRGLRLHNEKEYVTIIDFIGNYKNNFLIPIALSGDKTLNKDNVRRKTVDTEYIKGVSTINFEEIAKKRIFDAIDNATLSTLKHLQDSYIEVKNRINRIPNLHDFIQHNSLDPEVIIDFAKTYYDFLIKIEEVPTLTDYEKAVLTMFSKDFLNGKRVHEIILLEALLRYDEIDKITYKNLLKEYGTYYDDETISSVENIFSLNFYVTADKKKFGDKPILNVINDKYCLNKELALAVQQDYFKSYITDIIACAYENNKKYSKTEKLTLHKKYSRRDVCRLLNYERNEEGTLNGGRVRDSFCPIFVNYHKNDNDESVTKYMDEFISNEIFSWCSTKNRTINSKSMKQIIYSSEQNIQVLLFTKKHNGEGKDFYYLGEVAVNPDSAKNDILIEDGKEYSVVTMNFILKHPVQYDLYHYLIKE